MDKKNQATKNTLCLEQTNYVSPDNFTPALLLILETFKRSAYKGGHLSVDVHITAGILLSYITAPQDNQNQPCSQLVVIYCTATHSGDQGSNSDTNQIWGQL